MDFRIFLVDDEPSTLRFLEHMIKARCPGWQVAGTAENGRDALTEISALQPDLVITDIRMPVMSGTKFSEEARGRWPHIRVIILSGYEDFGAARTAMRLGISNYLLKPVNPAHLTKVLSEIRREILQERYRKALALLMRAMEGEVPPAEEARRCLPCQLFRGALVRTGSLPSRFSAQMAARGQPAGTEGDAAFLDGPWMLFGRDSFEVFVFVPETDDGSRRIETAAHLAGGLLGRPQRTVVVYAKAFPAEQIPAVSSKLMATVNNRLCLGVTQTIVGTAANEPAGAVSIHSDLEQQITALCAAERVDELREQVRGLFTHWTAEKKPFVYVEKDVRRFLNIVATRTGAPQEELPDYEPQLDQAMVMSSTMDELFERVWELALYLFNHAGAQPNPGTEAFFSRVAAYIDQNLSEPVSLQSLCDIMGISQTYMSRIFRKQTGLSFSEYLTGRRIGRAKMIMEERPELPLKTVASMVGYKDPFYFSKVFRAAEGMPPSHYSAEAGRQKGTAEDNP